VQVIDVRDLNFEIDTAAEWFDQLGLGPKAVVTKGLLQHQLGALPLEEDESLFIAGVKDAETEEIPIKYETACQVGADQFWHKARAHGSQSITLCLNAGLPAAHNDETLDGEGVGNAQMARQ
jgi:hypothetical protein